MNYINYCLNWGKELANSQYIAFNIILLILGLIGSIFIFYQMLKFINKLFTITKGSKEEKIQDKYYENEEKYYKNDLIKQKGEQK